MLSMRASTRSTQRLSQIARQFTSSSAARIGEDVYILSAVRTATAKFQGSFKDTPAPKLGAAVIKEAILRSKIPASLISTVYFGNVISSGLGQAPARQATIFSGLAPTTESITVNKVCASGLKAVSLAAQEIQLGHATAVVAGGMENMSLIPRYIPRTQPSYGHVTAEDGLMKDGLTDVYHNFAMGNCGENTAKKLGITRKDQDDYAIESYRRAKAAWDAGLFDEEIVGVEIPQRKGPALLITKDEEYEAINVAKIGTLKPAFIKETGTITAANASTLSDGASALVLASKAVIDEHGLQGNRALARIVSYADAATNPIDFPIAPALAIPKALERAGLELKDIALGHALGSSGSRIMVTLLHQLEKGEYGLAAICNGGGGATAMIVQKL
ncbi:putative acetyl-CoA acyltransferase [Peziza echinospora]|nr:putative acetyl-CoA acyltransferase [Peziza echinospora]